MIDLFISYATRDSQIAFRLYGDIIKSGGKAYLYERQDTLVNFEEEIKTSIESARGFCLIDSAEARKSKYVNFECNLILKQEHVLKNELFFVILAEPDIGDWREKSMLFEIINRIKYLDLTLTEYKSQDNKRYDYHDFYFNAVSEICNKLGLSFAMPHPGTKDFDKELNLYDIDGETVDQLKSEFRYLLDSFKSDDKHFNTRAFLIIDNCNLLNIYPICPHLVVGSYQLQRHEFALAKITYSNVISKSKKDPRGWIGLSYATQGIGKIKESLVAIKEAENIVLSNLKNPNLSCQYPNIIHNKIKLLIANEDFAQALKVLNSLDLKLLKLFEFKLLQLILNINDGLYYNTLDLYKDLIHYYTNNVISSNEMLLISDLEHCIGRFYFCQQDYYESIKHYQMAIYYNSNNVQFNAELAQIYYVLGRRKNEIKCIANKFIGYKTMNPQELYYLGLLKYLSKHRRIAKKLFNSVSSELNYPYYSKLIPKKSFFSLFLRILKSVF